MVASWSGPWLLIKIQLGRMAWSTTRGMDPGGFAAALGDWRGGGRCIVGGPLPSVPPSTPVPWPAPQSEREPLATGSPFRRLGGA